MLPSQFMSLPKPEKAFIIAAIDIRIKHEKQELKKSKRLRRRR